MSGKQMHDKAWVMPTREQGGNGKPSGDGYAQSRTTAQLSSAERSKVNDALIAQVGALTHQVNELARAVDGLLAFDREQDRRLDALERSAEIDRLAARDALGMTAMAAEQRLAAIERGAALLSAWIKRPLWERVRSRLGF